MSDAIIVAIIGAIGAIVDGVAPVVVQHLLQNRNKRRTPERKLNKERSGFFWEAVAALPAAVVALAPPSCQAIGLFWGNCHCCMVRDIFCRYAYFDRFAESKNVIEKNGVGTVGRSVEIQLKF